MLRQVARLLRLSSLACVVTVGLAAAEEHAPLPERLVAAKTVCLINESGDLKSFGRT